MRYIFFILLGLYAQGQGLQPKIKEAGGTEVVDSLVVDNGQNDSLKIFIPTIEDYKYRTQLRQYQTFDTTFTIDKYYRFTHYNNQDNFGKVPFSNIGAGFQELTFRLNPEQNLTLLPTNKAYFIKGIGDIRYYDVKTPTTAFVYHNGVNNGGALQSTYTQNIGKNFNFAIEYMGLRSKGFYRRSLAANNHFTISAHYLSPNGKYQAYAHYTHQNINTEENGGIVNLDNYLNDSRFKNRENLEINLSASDSRFSYRRYYYRQEFRPFTSEKFPFKIKHTLYHQSNKYIFNLSTSDAYWVNIGGGSLLTDMPTGSQKYSKTLSNTLSLLWDHSRFKLDAGLRHQSLKLATNSPQMPYLKTENRLGVLGNIKVNLWDRINLYSFLELSRGHIFGTYLRTTNRLRIEPIKDYIVDAEANFQSAVPSFNAWVNSSPYSSFNYHNSDLKNQNILEIKGKIELKKWFQTQLSTTYFRVAQYTYFDSLGQPQQLSSALNILQLGGAAHFQYGRFHLAPRVLVQSVLTNQAYLPQPHFIGRLNLYYQTDAFKKAAEIQTGLNLYYFSKFKSRDYLPMLNEFGLSQSKNITIGGQPIASAYFNLKVKRMLIYAEAQHFNTTFMKNQSYTAPYYPISDFRLNLGIVWYLFY